MINPSFRCLPILIAAQLLACCLAAGCGSRNAANQGPRTKDLPIVQQSFSDVKPLEPQESSIVNSVGMTLNLIEPGSFTAGWPDTDNPDYDEFGGVQHEVTISRPYYIGIHEVTQSQYEQVMGTNPSRNSPTSATPQYAERYKDIDTADYPVEQVSWNDAMEFCLKLSELDEEKTAGRVYTLPTEAQWEYACRAGNDSIFHTGDSLISTQANFDGNYPYPQDAEKGPFLQRPTSVGSYEPNDWGLYDMHGNVQEWCLDGAREYLETPVTDPSAESELSEYRVLRGGSFRRNGNYQRCGFRNLYPLTSKLYDIGFRVIVQQ